MKQEIKIDFADFWLGFDKQNNYFYNLLKQKYALVISDKPDLLIYSVFGKQHQKYDCLRVLYSGENRGSDFTACDYAFTCDFNVHPRHFRLPFYIYCFPPERFVKPELDYEQLAREKQKFCCMVVSNPGGKVRNRFYELLTSQKHVDSGGKFKNTIGYRVPHKEAFIREYKFNLAFENRSWPGYTTEKLPEAMFTYTIPIYWGNPLIHRDFNQKSFLNYHEFGSAKALVQRILEVDKNEKLYLQYLREPWCHGNKLPEQLQPEYYLDAFSKIIESPVELVATKRKSFAFYWHKSGYRLGKVIRRGYL